MGLNTSKGNMYGFITHTWNTIKGECPHGCSYCYMGRRGKQKPVRFDEKELKTDLGSGNFIFVGSSCDMWAKGIPKSWITATINHCKKYENTYMFQTKKPDNIIAYLGDLTNSIVCTTLESDFYYPKIMKDSPPPIQRSLAMEKISQFIDTYVTIEPILDFNLEQMVKMIQRCNPKQVNIGADSGRNNLPEPSKEKVLGLISELQKFTIVHNKSNLRRLL